MKIVRNLLFTVLGLLAAIMPIFKGITPYPGNPEMIAKSYHVFPGNATAPGSFHKKFPRTKLVRGTFDYLRVVLLFRTRVLYRKSTS